MHEHENWTTQVGLISGILLLFTSFAHIGSFHYSVPAKSWSLASTELAFKVMATKGPVVER